MKAKINFRNTALALMLILSPCFSFSQTESTGADNLLREKMEFSGAGYWIDAVVVTTPAYNEDKVSLADEGYFIEPVVVVYNGNIQNNSSRNSVLTTTGTGMTGSFNANANTLEVSLLNNK